MFVVIGVFEMTFSIFNFGCKVNQYESQVMTELMLNRGYEHTEDRENADIMIINSCTVTAVSDNKVMKLIRHLRRKNENAVIVLTGCMPQAYPNLKEEFSQVDIVLGNSMRSELPDEIEKFLINREQIVNVHKYARNSDFELVSVSNFEERTRAFIKIEDGCNRYCSYCIIPYARGPVRSKPIDVLKKELEHLAAHGYKEIVLVGINLSAYGQELGLHLCDAVECACSIEGVERVRLGSLEPERMDRESIERLSKLEKFCPQFHLSLQSGCDATLKRMNRHYTTQEYKKIVGDLRDAFPNCSITTDVMVGFAGETEEEFSASVSFVKEIAFAKTHVFPYSQREGTVAAKAPNQIDNSVKSQRSRIMIEATSDTRKAFLESQVGLEEKVLFEQPTKDGYWEGYTMNYTPVKVKSDKALSGEILKIKLERVEGEFCIGEIIQN